MQCSVASFARLLRTPTTSSPNSSLHFLISTYRIISTTVNLRSHIERTSLSVGLVLGRNVLERNLDVLLAKVHLGGEGGVGLPLARGARSGLLHHLVDLLEGKTLGLGDEEVGEDDW